MKRILDKQIYLCYTYRDTNEIGLVMDEEMYNKLTDEEKKFYKEFEREAEAKSPKTRWGKDRRRDRVKDIFDKFEQQKSVPRYYMSAYRQNFDDAVNREIDLERGTCAGNDLAPGLIRTTVGYKCAVITPHGTKRMFFSLDREEDARAWIQKIRDEYKDYCYDAY